MKTYEWDYETLDENGDIMEHDHADRLSDFSESQKTDTLVLVMDEGKENSGIESRSWAYVKDGKLPDFFSDAFQRPVSKVPERFHKELERYIK